LTYLDPEANNVQVYGFDDLDYYSEVRSVSGKLVEVPERKRRGQLLDIKAPRLERTLTGDLDLTVIRTSSGLLLAKFKPYEEKVVIEEYDEEPRPLIEADRQRLEQLASLGAEALADTLTGEEAMALRKYSITL